MGSDESTLAHVRPQVATEEGPFHFLTVGLEVNDRFAFQSYVHFVLSTHLCEGQSRPVSTHYHFTLAYCLLYSKA